MILWPLMLPTVLDSTGLSPTNPPSLYSPTGPVQCQPALAWTICLSYSLVFAGYHWPHGPYSPYLWSQCLNLTHPFLPESFFTPGLWSLPYPQCWFWQDFHWVCSSLCCIAHSSLLLPPVSGLPPLLLPPSTGPRSHPLQPSFKHNTHIPALATVQKVLAFHSSYLWCNNPMTSYIALPIQPPLTMVTLDPNAEGFKPVTKQSQTDQKRWGTPNVCPAGESRVWNGNQDHFSNSLTVIMTHFDWHSRCSIFVEELLKYDPSLAFSVPEDNTDILYLQYYAFPMTKKDFA